MLSKVLPNTKYHVSNTHASLYKTFRPTYNKPIFSFISAFLKKWPPECSLSVAVDVGCGSGQATCQLHDIFDYVVGIDTSPTQLKEALACVRDTSRLTDFIVATCDSIPLCTASCNYIQVFQAAHWFDLPKFYAEVDRILKPGGTMGLGVYGYGELNVQDNEEFLKQFKIDGFSQLKRDFMMFDNFLIENGYFPSARRAAVDSLYRDYLLPYTDQIRCFNFQMKETWSSDALIGYLSSWSSWQRYVASTGDTRVLDDLRKKLEKVVDNQKRIEISVFYLGGKMILVTSLLSFLGRWAYICLESHKL